MKSHSLDEIHELLSIKQRDVNDLRGALNSQHPPTFLDFLESRHPEIKDSMHNLIRLGYLAGDLACNDDRGIIEATRQFPVSALVAYSLGAFPCKVVADVEKNAYNFHYSLKLLQNDIDFDNSIPPPSVEVYKYWTQIKQGEIRALSNPLSFQRLANSKSPVVVANDPDSLDELQRYVNARKCPLIFTNKSGNFVEGVSKKVVDSAFDIYGIEDGEIFGFIRVPKLKTDMPAGETLQEEFIGNPYVLHK